MSLLIDRQPDISFANPGTILAPVFAQRSTLLCLFQVLLAGPLLGLWVRPPAFSSFLPHVPVASFPLWCLDSSHDVLNHVGL